MNSHVQVTGMIIGLFMFYMSYGVSFHVHCHLCHRFQYIQPMFYVLYVQNYVHFMLWYGTGTIMSSLLADHNRFCRLSCCLTATALGESHPLFGYKISVPAYVWMCACVGLMYRIKYACVCALAVSIHISLVLWGENQVVKAYRLSSQMQSCYVGYIQINPSGRLSNITGHIVLFHEHSI